MNRATCGLQNSDSPTSDNLTPQETTKQDSGTVGADGAGLSCPGSSVVAESRQDDSALAPLIKSPALSNLRSLRIPKTKNSHRLARMRHKSISA